MTRPVINVAAVSYLNTIPFLYGIRHSANGPDINLLLSPPNGCTEAFDSRRADIALIPVGGLARIKDPDFDIVTSWCIGADGPVRTVVMVSGSPLKKIRRVWLDSHSMTSAALAKVLAARYWNISPEWANIDWSDEFFVKSMQMQGLRRDVQGSVPGVRDRANHEHNAADAYFLREGDAFVLIGDKVFEQEGRFEHTWDLAEEWRKHTGLPFVFAVWVARKSVPDDVIAALENALTMGVERVYEAILESDHAERAYAYEYLTRNIDYFFDEQKRGALQRFWDTGLRAILKINPG